MTSNTIKELQYFVGKVCSVVTTSMNRNFDETISREHFVIRVQTINADGVWGTHPYNDDLVSFFTTQHVISIHEEVELDSNNPEHASMMKEYEERTGEKLESDIKAKVKAKNKPQQETLPIIEKKEAEQDQQGDASFVDIFSLESLAEQSRRTFEAQDQIFKK
jgi:hypothetical protein